MYTALSAFQTLNHNKAQTVMTDSDLQLLLSLKKRVIFSLRSFHQKSSPGIFSWAGTNFKKLAESRTEAKLKAKNPHVHPPAG